MSLNTAACRCPAAAPGRVTGEVCFPRWSRAQRRSPIEVRGRLPELRRRARPLLSSAKPAGQHPSPHLAGNRFVRRCPHDPCRQRLEPLVAPPLRLGHLVAHLLCQLAEGLGRGPSPELRAHRVALHGLEVPLRGLHVVPRVAERCTEVVVRRGPIGPQGDGLAVGPGCSAPVLFRAVPRAHSHQLVVRVARLRSEPGCPLRGLALPLLMHPTILPLLPVPLHLLV
eukprot:scaffold115910_cov63-Phaeocystis_antarctica.AAC.1